MAPGALYCLLSSRGSKGGVGYEDLRRQFITAWNWTIKTKAASYVDELMPKAGKVRTTT
jgi:hypothetical protein